MTSASPKRPPIISSKSGSEEIAAAEEPVRERVLILDFGSQYTHLITRRVRELEVYSELLRFDADPTSLDLRGVCGIILSGGPRSVYDEDAPRLPKWVLEQSIPVLGICYGLQAIAFELGGEASVLASDDGGEYGPADIRRVAEGESHLLEGVSPSSRVWMSHGDRVENLPPGFRLIASSDPCPIAAVEHESKPWFGLQFHPEVHHSKEGSTILENFLFKICGASHQWKMSSFVDETIDKVRAQVGEDHVVLGVSGGVDSTVAAVLLDKALGKQLTCIFVDHGLLRENEAQEVEEAFRESFHISLVAVDASERFLSELRGVSDPEEKRRIIGRVFVEVFEAEAKKIPGARFLGQGTLYPDVIESVSPQGGPSVTIKTHHNVGGLPERLGFELVEPLRTLFKDEVRALGRELGISDKLLERHPFPGPGLAVRCLGAVEEEDLALLRKADLIAREELEASGAMKTTSQSFVVLLPVRSVGVQGDNRTYERVVALRCVETPDFMTADWADLPRDLLARISNRIINEVRGINRVVYDISSKPPATIEWE